MTPRALDVAALLVIAFAVFGGVQTVRLANTRAAWAAERATAAQEVASALRAAQTRANAAESARAAAQDALAAMVLDLEQARAARATAERRLFDAFDTDPDLAGPGLPDRVRREIRAHWAGQ